MVAIMVAFIVASLLFAGFVVVMVYEDTAVAERGGQQRPSRR
jgi:hypothetical protein